MRITRAHALAREVWFRIIAILWTAVYVYELPAQIGDFSDVPSSVPPGHLLPTGEGESAPLPRGEDGTK